MGPAAAKVAAVPLRLAGIVLAVAALLAGGWLWLRDSSFVRVRDVYVVGLSSNQAKGIRASLRRAALDMTTLHVREQDLRHAVAPYSSVADLRVQADFPGKLTIEVVEREPLALVEIGDRRVPVGAGGMVMRGVRAEEDLPVVPAGRIAPQDRLADRRTLATLEVLAAGPVELRRRVEGTRSTPRGLVLDMDEGPDLVFGGASQPRAKWAAAVRVLADHASAGATYLDLRVPDRVAAGGLGPVANPLPGPEVAATLDPQ